jgi:hypothetical protein
MRARSKWARYRPEFVRLVAKLREQHMDVDRIPYTDLFDALYSEFTGRYGSAISRSEFYWELVVTRKNFAKFAERYGAN